MARYGRLQLSKSTCSGAAYSEHSLLYSSVMAQTLQAPLPCQRTDCSISRVERIDFDSFTLPKQHDTSDGTQGCTGVCTGPNRLLLLPRNQERPACDERSAWATKGRESQSMVYMRRRMLGIAWGTTECTNVCACIRVYTGTSMSPGSALAALRLQHAPKLACVRSASASEAAGQPFSVH
jgi:hypothetical protein